MRVAILDDYQQVALSMADWSVLPPEVKVDTFRDHLFDEQALVQRLSGYDVIMGMRERTPMQRSLLQQLPNLKLLLTSGMGNASFDMTAATDLGITVCGTSMGGGPSTAELAWGLIISLARGILSEDAGVRRGEWQLSVGDGLAGKTLGVVGLGRLGTVVARVGLAFQMNVLAWSTNLTPERAQENGVTYAAKEELFSTSDFISIHLVLSDRSRGLISASDLALMKPTAYLINTSRGPIVDEDALARVLEQRSIAGAGLDVFSVEPLPLDHPFRRLDNTVITPHLGYVTKEGYRAMFSHTIENIQAFMEQEPVRVINSAVLERPNLRRLG